MEKDAKDKNKKDVLRSIPFFMWVIVSFALLFYGAADKQRYWICEIAIESFVLGFGLLMLTSKKPRKLHLFVAVTSTALGVIGIILTILYHFGSNRTREFLSPFAIIFVLVFIMFVAFMFIGAIVFEIRKRVETQSKPEALKENAQDQKDGANDDVPSFAFGIEGSAGLNDSDCLVVWGAVKGHISKGMAGYLSSPWVDDDKILLTEVVEIEISDNGEMHEVSEITNGRAGICLKKAGNFSVKPGSVFYGRNASFAEIYSAYTGALGNRFALNLHNIEDEEFYELSANDLGKIYSMYWAYRKDYPITDSDIERQTEEKAERLISIMAEKIISSESLYAVYSKRTGEPYMFSVNVKQENGNIITTPPDIMLISKAGVQMPGMRERYSQNAFELKLIENGDSEDGIRNFLGEAFFLNGACGIRYNGMRFSIDRSKIMSPPDYSGMKEINVPVTNPDLLRWILMMGQIDMENPRGDEEFIYGLYNGFLMRELPKARFLIPMIRDDSYPAPDEDGKVVLEKGTRFGLLTLTGKYDRDAIRMYTDWKRLIETCGDEYSGFIQPIEGFIDIYDCAINVTDHPAAGIYVGKDTYEKAASLIETGKLEYTDEKSPVYFHHRGERYTLISHPYEPCLYIKNDRSGSTCTLHNAINPDEIVAAFSKGDAISCLGTGPMDENTFCGILSFALDKGIDDVDFADVVRMKEKYKIENNSVESG